MENKYIFIIILVFCFILVCKLLYKPLKKSDIISVGIPCIFKHIKFLDKIIININEQVLLPYEIIISISEINNYDINNLQKNLNKLSKIDVKIISTEKKQYAGENRNICGNHCNTEVISFIDADDLMCPNRIKVLEEIYNKYNYDMLFHSYTNNLLKCSNSISIIKDKDINYQYYKLKQYDKVNENISIYLEGEIAHGHITIKSSILNKYPFDHKGYGEDTRYIHTIFKNDLNVISLPYYKGTAYLSENSSWK